MSCFVHCTIHTAAAAVQSAVQKGGTASVQRLEVTLAAHKTTAAIDAASDWLKPPASTPACQTQGTARARAAHMGFDCLPKHPPPAQSSSTAACAQTQQNRNVCASMLGSLPRTTGIIQMVAASQRSQAGVQMTGTPRQLHGVDNLVVHSGFLQALTVCDEPFLIITLLSYKEYVAPRPTPPAVVTWSVGNRPPASSSSYQTSLLSFTNRLYRTSRVSAA